MTTRDDLVAMVLSELARSKAEIAARPRPPAWKTWEARPDADDREYGPRYSPTWFGDRAATEAHRVRLLRTVYRLADAGLIEVTKSEGGGLNESARPPPGRTLRVVCSDRLTVEGRNLLPVSDRQNVYRLCRTTAAARNRHVPPTPETHPAESRPGRGGAQKS